MKGIIAFLFLVSAIFSGPVFAEKKKKKLSRIQKILNVEKARLQGKDVSEDESDDSSSEDIEEEYSEESEENEEE